MPRWRNGERARLEAIRKWPRAKRDIAIGYAILRLREEGNRG